MIFIRHRTAENNQRLLSHGFKNILFVDNMHYVDLYLYLYDRLDQRRFDVMTRVPV